MAYKREDKNSQLFYDLGGVEVDTLSFLFFSYYVPTCSLLVVNLLFYLFFLYRYQCVTLALVYLVIDVCNDQVCSFC